MTLAILGLDACDYQLVREWNCSNMQLEQCRPLDTFTHSLDVPWTPEVWATIATGVGPDEHGIQQAHEWNSPVLQAASKVTQFFPDSVRYTLGKPFRDDSMTSPTTDHDHVFKHGLVTNWPGITPARMWQQSTAWFGDVNHGELSVKEWEDRAVAQTGAAMGWLATASERDIPVVGVHTHALDHGGHILCKRPDRLREVYQQVDQLVGDLRELVDELLILSDHGMQVTGIEDDDEPGVHSFRAMVSGSDPDWLLPRSVDCVREWIEAETTSDAATSAPKSRSQGVQVDAPTDHLRDLGYLS